jgi:hypothetical protein
MTNAVAAVRLELTLNGLDFTETPLNSTANQYIFYVQPTLTNVFPLGGPLTGASPTSVFGRNFALLPSLVAGGYYKCKFVSATSQLIGGIGLESTVTNETLFTCKSPMSYLPGLANISVTYNGQDYTTTMLQYVYYRQAILLDISPWLGPVTGGTLVTVRVEGAVTPLGLENSACRFGEIVVRPENLSDTAISCRAPLVFVSQPALLAITLNLADYVSRSNVKYLFYNEPVVGAITPTGGSIHGNTTVVATGGLFKVSPDQLVIYCVFGSVRVQSVLFDKAQVSCQSPSAPVGEWSKGPIKFAVSLNGVDLGTKFDYVYHGSNVNLALGFRDVSVDFFTPSKIDALRTTMSAQLGVDLANVRITSIGNKEITPRFSSRRQQTNTSASNAPPSGILKMNFQIVDQPHQTASGASQRFVSMVNSGSLQTLPNLTHAEAGDVPPYVGTDDGSVIGVQPMCGPTRGGTVVDVFGNGFRKDIGGLACRFGTNGANPQLAPIVKFMNPTHIQCTTPKMPYADIFLVEVSLNGAEFSESKPQVFFHFYTQPSIKALMPVAGPSYGNYAVTIDGNDFADVERTLFRAKLSTPGFVTFAPCVFRDRNTALCTVPQVTMSELNVSLNESFVLKLEIGMNGVLDDYTNSEGPVTFSYYEQPMLTGGEALESRMAGPSLYRPAAGTKPILLTVRGAPFVSTQLGTTVCRFDDYTDPGTNAALTVPAGFIDPKNSIVTCRLPYVSSTGRTRVSISENKVHFTNTSLDFDFLCDYGHYATGSNIFGYGPLMRRTELSSEQQCEQCPPGFYAELLGQTACTACAAGYANVYYGGKSNKECKKCAFNWVAPIPGQTACFKCPPMSASNERQDACPCIAGYFGIDGVPIDQCISCSAKETCVDCKGNGGPPVNCSKPGLTMVELVTESGFWRHSNRSRFFYQCPPDACVGGNSYLFPNRELPNQTLEMQQAANGARAQQKLANAAMGLHECDAMQRRDDFCQAYDGENFCAAGYTSVTCAVCDWGYGMSGNGACVSCAEKPWLNYMFVVAVPLWTLFQMVSMVVSTMGGSDLDQRIAVMMKILTDYLQIGKHATKLLVYNTQTTHSLEKADVFAVSEDTIPKYSAVFVSSLAPLWLLWPTPFCRKLSACPGFALSDAVASLGLRNCNCPLESSSTVPSRSILFLSAARSE